MTAMTGTVGTAAVSGEHISLTYQGAGGSPVEALREVSFRFTAGRFVSLVGPSGCGKTTLLKIFGDLLQPTSGTLTIGGRTPGELRRRRHVGHMFQDATLLPWKTIGDNIRLLSSVAGRPIDERRTRELAELVGIEDFLGRYPHELSGGMRQRASLARAYALDPEILLMDEPFGALDEITRERMNSELLRIWEQRRQTVVFVTHSIGEAAYLSDTVYVMAPRPGRIVAEIDVDLPRPRSANLRFGSEMNGYVERIHKALLAAMSGEVS